MKLLFFVLSTLGVEKSLYGRYYILGSVQVLCQLVGGNYNVTMTFARVTFVRVRILYVQGTFVY